MVLVEGAIVDAEGSRKGYVRIQRGRILETGKLGTDSTKGRIRRIRGIVLPAAGNGHTHIGDSISTVEPPFDPIERLVRPPDGLKFRLLRDSSRAAKIAAMRRALRRMAEEGTGITLDFREEGIDGVRQARSAARGVPTQLFALGRPLRRPVVPRELNAVLELADGIGVSAAREESVEDRRTISRACRSAKKPFALHASETVRESPDDYLDPRPDLLVHLSNATEGDLERVGDSGVTVAVCPRSNALFGRRPKLSLFEKHGIRWMIGTDNGMFNAPSIFRELEYAYLSARAAGNPVPPSALVRAAFVEPWRWVGQPSQALVAPGGASRPLILSLPADDPYYQVVARAAEHVIVRTPQRRRRRPRSR